MDPSTLVVWCGFAVGLLFGALGQRTAYCMAGGLREWWTEHNPTRAGALLLALAAALLGTQILAEWGWIDLRRSIYFQSGFSWLLLPVGGVLFGYGMMMARGCGARALVLLGSGNLRSFVVLLALGLAAAITLTGPLAPWRLALTEGTLVHWTATTPSLLGWRTDPSGPSVGRLIFVALLVLMGLKAALFGMGLRRHPGRALGALAIGALVPVGWYVTGHLGADDFEPVALESLTFVAPISDSILYLMLSTGVRAGFGVAVVAGVLVGALAAALLTREFEWRAFESPAQMRRSIGGGLLMGVGGALAMGCSVGQGLTGLSTMAIPSVMAVAGIVAGAYLATKGPLRVRA